MIKKDNRFQFNDYILETKQAINRVAEFIPKNNQGKSKAQPSVRPQSATRISRYAGSLFHANSRQKVPNVRKKDNLESALVGMSCHNN